LFQKAIYSQPLSAKGCFHIRRGARADNRSDCSTTV